MALKRILAFIVGLTIALPGSVGIVLGTDVSARGGGMDDGGVLEPGLWDPRVGTDGGCFVENLGQLTREEILLYSPMGAGGVAFCSGRVLYNVVGTEDTLHLRDLMMAMNDGPEGIAGLEHEYIDGCMVSLSFEGADPVVPVGRGLLPGTSSYILGDDAARWRSGVSRYSQVVYHELWPGIDLVYRWSPQGLKYEFILAPGADVLDIDVRVDGHTGLDLSSRGMVIDTAAGRITDTDLVAFYADGPGETIRSSFALRGEDAFGFQLGDHDESREVVIDPLVYSTYLGGTEMDSIQGVVRDDDDRLCVVGSTTSVNFPVTNGAYQTLISGGTDAFFARFSPNGSAIEVCTYIGGGGVDVARDLAIRSDGDIVIVGSTMSSDFPIIRGAIQPAYGGGLGDGFVCTLVSGGTRLDTSTYLGASGRDTVNAVELGTRDEIFLAGTTDSTGFNTTQGAFQRTLSGDRDAFVCKLREDATARDYSTFLGGKDLDTAEDLVVDGSGRAHVVGYTLSPGFPTTAGSYQPNLAAGSVAAFVSKVASDGASLAYSTFLGSADTTQGRGIALEANGSVVVVGGTTDARFPTTPGAFQRALKGGKDAFVSRLDVNGQTLQSSSLLGGTAEDEAISVATDGAGNVSLCGNTGSPDLPVTNDAEQRMLRGSYDGHVARISADMGTLEHCTYLGSSGLDELNGVLYDDSLSVVVIGTVEGNNYPTTENAYAPNFKGTLDGVLSVLGTDSQDPVAVAGPDVTVDQHETVGLNGSASHDDIAIVNWTWTFDYNGTAVTLYGPRANFTFHLAGLFHVTLTVTDWSGRVGNDTMNVTVRDITPPIADAGPDQQVRQNERVIMSGEASWDNVGISNFTWSISEGGSDLKLSGRVVEHVFTVPGEHLVTLNVSDAAGNWDTDDLTVTVVDDTAPVVDLGPDLEVDQHETVILDGANHTSDMDVVEYNWTIKGFAEPLVLHGPYHEVTFDEVGLYEVTLVVRDASGNPGVGRLKVTVLDTTPPDASAGPDQQVEVFTQTTLDGSGSWDNCQIASYQWTFLCGDDEVTLTGIGPTYMFEGLGLFEITLLVTDLRGNTATDDVVVTVVDSTPPEVHGVGDIEVDQHEEVEFDAGLCTDNLGITDWWWTFEDEGEPRTLEGTQASYVFEVAGVYAVQLTLRDGSGNEASASFDVTVVDVTSPVADAGGDRQVDQGSMVALDGTASHDDVGIAWWGWTFEYEGQEVNLEGASTTHVFDVPGVYEVLLRVADDEGNMASASFLLTVVDTEAPVAMTQGDIELEAGSLASFDASGSTDNVGVASWTWTFREGGKEVTLEGERVEHRFESAGVYKVMLVVQDAQGNTAEETFTVEVDGEPSTLFPWILGAVVIVGCIVAALWVWSRR